jgi:hypothetical protein
MGSPFLIKEGLMEKVDAKYQQNHPCIKNKAVKS